MLKRALLFLLAGIVAAAPAWAEDKDAEFKERLRQALKENPGLILEVLEKHRAELYHIARRGAEEDQDRQWRRNLSKAMEHPLPVALDESRPIIGPKGARFSVVDFSDFLCGACTIGAENVDKLLKKHPLEVRLQMKHNPSDELSRQLAVYYEAIGRQDTQKAWRFAKTVYQRQEEIRRRKLEAVQEILVELKINQSQLARDLADKSIAEYIKQDEAEADRLKFHSTPTFVVNGVAITGAAPVKIFEQVMALWNARHAPSPAGKKGGSQ